ncbi:hypothetical protein [Pseudomonas sp. 1928-m]|nr:hypothetical protein [Pseudomonas sp. 1928-m]MDF3196771.1 hypothetical protein [Pseudomonas sp. 1928-m]
MNPLHSIVYRYIVLGLASTVHAPSAASFAMKFKALCGVPASAGWAA